MNSLTNLPYLLIHADSLSHKIEDALVKKQQPGTRVHVLHFSAKKIAFYTKALLIGSTVLGASIKLVTNDSNVYRRSLYLYLMFVSGFLTYYASSELYKNLKVLEGRISLFNQGDYTALQPVYFKIRDREQVTYVI